MGEQRRNYETGPSNCMVTCLSANDSIHSLTKTIQAAEVSSYTQTAS